MTTTQDTSECQDSGTLARRSNLVHGGRAYCEGCDQLVPVVIRVTNTTPYVKAPYYANHG